jgi:hypothetical protein
MSEEKPAKEVKTWKCPACHYRGDGIVKDIPPVFKGQTDSKGTYCPKCLQDWFYRNISQMPEVK